MTTDLDSLEALALKATPGPWHECPMQMFVFGPGGGDMIASTDDNGELLIRGHGARLPMEANAHFIAAANPSVILDLIRRVREAEGKAGALNVSIDTARRWRDRAIDERDALRAERDAARVDGRMLAEAARRLGVDTEGLKPAHVFRAIETLKRERDAALHEAAAQQSAATGYARRASEMLVERDAALALRDDAETTAQVLEANLAGQLARLREEKAAAESALRTATMRIEEVMAERDARPAIAREDAACVDNVSPRHFDEHGKNAAHRVFAALREHRRAK